jgi:hypothetical protein
LGRLQLFSMALEGIFNESATRIEAEVIST